VAPRWFVLAFAPLFIVDEGRFCPSCWFREFEAEFPGVKPEEFIVRTGAFAAPVAGDVRAITDRFCTEDGGVATRELVFPAPA
jgi:hypothetical protein